ncbi:Bifunctional protein FolD protein [subsurface metagenome]
MPAQIISGTEIARQIREELKDEIDKLKEQHNLIPGLATVLVGEDPASQVYVGQKEKTSKALGLYSERYDLSADTSEEELLALVDRLNKDPKIHGILVQLPLPKHINGTTVLCAINPQKDVDGFHPVNLGKLMIGEPDYLPCTPHGIQQLLVRSGIEIEGAEVVVVGRSNIVGKPIANILLQKKEGANATVTVCHTRTRDISLHTRMALPSAVFPIRLTPTSITTTPSLTMSAVRALGLPAATIIISALLV